MENFDALHLVFLGIDDAKHALVTAIDDVAHYGATGFVNVVGTTDDDDARWAKELFVDHRDWLWLGGRVPPLYGYWVIL